MKPFSRDDGNDSPMIATKTQSELNSRTSTRLDLIVPPPSPLFPLSDMSTVSNTDHARNSAMPPRTYEVVVHSSHSPNDSPGALTPKRDVGALTPLRDMEDSELSGLRASELSNHSRNYEVVLHDPQSRKVCMTLQQQQLQYGFR